MVTGHFSRGTMQRFFRSELLQDEAREVVRHLLTGCTICVATARFTGALEGFPLSENEWEAEIAAFSDETYSWKDPVI
ncbi:MAG TPA: hypothetical protein VHU81_06565 [Thermoanaerobaculia bacterium]|jgi:hypothetical protein|nr:hypothetical protein [Thermoanaerobaculia bacterium]